MWVSILEVFLRFILYVWFFPRQSVDNSFRARLDRLRLKLGEIRQRQRQNNVLGRRFDP